MRLLLLTQAVDLDDPVLGFVHGWIAEFSKRFEHIHVVCLKEGRHELPKNVTVHSLGKCAQGGPASGWETGTVRLKYISRFFRFAWTLRHEYDAVFVHMNQEYVLLGGWLWRLLRKKVYLWRNHWAGSWLTDVAALFCTKLFCTSRHSYTAKFAHTKLMPVGVDTSVFTSMHKERQAGSMLSIGRIAPSKRLEVLLEALGQLKGEGVSMTADIYGDALERDSDYLARLKTQVGTLGLEGLVRFHPAVPNAKTPALYSSHELFYNGSKSGMYDKTIVEAAACGALPIAASEDFAKEADKRLAFNGTSQSLVFVIRNALALSDSDKGQVRKNLEEFVEGHSLHALGIRLADEIR